MEESYYEEDSQPINTQANYNSAAPQTDEKLEDILRSKNKKKKPFKKTWSFGATNWKNSFQFMAGETEDITRKDSTTSFGAGSETESLMPKDKTDIVGASGVKTFFNIVKSFVGTGILFLPAAFRDGGIVFSPLMLALIAIITLAGMLRLVSCWEDGRGTFGDIAERAYGVWGKYLIDFFLVLAQLSFCCVYMVFIAETFLQVTELHDWPLAYAVLLEIPILTPLVWIRHVYKLSPASFFGTLCIAFGAGYITYYDIYLISTEGRQETEFFNARDFALFLGTAVYTFEGIGTIIPIQQSMKEKHKFKSILTFAILLILAIIIGFSIVGYMAFGEAVRGPITLNLPEGDIFVKVVLALYLLAIIFSYPLIIFPAVEILQKLVFKPGPVTTKRKWLKNLFRFVIVCVTAGIAIGGGEDFEKFVSLVGGFVATPLGIIFPPLFHFRTVSKTFFQKFIDITLILLGTVIAVFATGYAIYAWATE